MLVTTENNQWMCELPLKKSNYQTKTKNPFHHIKIFGSHLMRSWAGFFLTTLPVNNCVHRFGRANGLIVSFGFVIRCRLMR